MSDDPDLNFLMRSTVLLVLFAVVGVTLGIVGFSGPFSTTMTGTVSQVSQTWGFTTINFISTSQSVSCWGLGQAPSVGAHITVVRPAWTFYHCLISP
jgi:hypothetical protein